MNISNLSEKEQKVLHTLLKNDSYKLTLDNSDKIGDLSTTGELAPDSVETILKKKTDGAVDSKPHTIAPALVSKYFLNMKPDEIEAELAKILEAYYSPNE